LSIPPPANLPASPPIPLTPELRAAYQALNDQLETAIEGTADVTALQALNAQQAQVDDVLQKDAIYQLGANTDAFNALLTQINNANSGLKTLQTQIKSTADHFHTADQILSAIGKVFSLLGIV
jgi:hypothetical protein